MSSRGVTTGSSSLVNEIGQVFSLNIEYKNMLPVIVIVGRPNVGKSTLFNWLTKSRDALVADVPGVTRDRQYGRGVIGDHPYFVVDTGGIEEPDDPNMAAMTLQQVELAIQDADVIFFMVDAKVGATPPDQAIADRLRPYSDKVFVLPNKTDHRDPNVVCSEFYSLGLGDPVAIAAKRGQGVKTLMADVLSSLELTEETEDTAEGTKIAIVGRPNVGKSTLINRILGEERVVVFDKPGTTRDSIYIPYERRGQKYTLIDTAGVRRRAKVSDFVEKISLIKTLQAMESAHVVVLVLNAREGISSQDLRLLGIAINLGKGLVLAINKWDDMDETDRDHIKTEIDRLMPYADFARRYFISALHGTGVGMLYRAIDETYDSACKEIGTGQLTRVLEKAVADHQPPLVRGRRVKPRFAHLGGHHPMIVLVHGKQMNELPSSYKRYLVNYFRNAFKLRGIPLIIRFKNDANPYVDNPK